VVALVVVVVRTIIAHLIAHLTGLRIDLLLVEVVVVVLVVEYSVLVERLPLCKSFLELLFHFFFKYLFEKLLDLRPRNQDRIKAESSISVQIVTSSNGKMQHQRAAVALEVKIRSLATTTILVRSAQRISVRKNSEATIFHHRHLVVMSRDENVAFVAKKVNKLKFI
jgi:hypothetical protein